MAADRAIRRIVVGVDGSAHSRAALDWAISMAKGMGSEVTAVYAVFVPTYVTEPLTMPLQYDESWRADIEAEFKNEWCAPLREAGVKYHAVMEDGRPAVVIDRVAESENADVIVVGRRGRGGVAEALLGSVSHELALRARRPVLLIEPARDHAQA